METFQRRVNDLLFQQQKKRPWLSAETGIPISTLNNWFSRARMPGADQLVKIARALGTTVEYLMTGEAPDSQNITPGQRRLLNHFAGRSDQEIDEFIAALESMRDYARKTPRFGR